MQSSTLNDLIELLSENEELSPDQIANSIDALIDPEVRESEKIEFLSSMAKKEKLKVNSPIMFANSEPGPLIRNWKNSQVMRLIFAEPAEIRQAVSTFPLSLHFYSHQLE